MLYREAGQYKTSYEADAAVFPLRQDRIAIAVILLIAFVLLPLAASDFMLSSVMIPILIFSLAAIALNILTGYTGLISLGTAGFMGVGGYACYKLTSIFPGINIIVHIALSGFFAAGIVAPFRLPWLRVWGVYLVVALVPRELVVWRWVRVGGALVFYNV